MSAVFWQEAARRDLIEHYVYLAENADQEVADRFLASDDLNRASDEHAEG